MKKIIFILAAAALLATACTSESIELSEQLNTNYSNLSYRVETSAKGEASREETVSVEYCYAEPLIAGQTIDVGNVSFGISGDDIVVTYETVSDWSINEVHLSFSDCNDLSFPVTGSGNPQIGKFEYGSTYEEGVSVVSYFFNAEGMSDQFCVAAHAVVENADGDQETAWAGDIDFGGRSWAAYASVDLTLCDIQPDR